MGVTWPGKELPMMPASEGRTYLDRLTGSQRPRTPVPARRTRTHFSLRCFSLCSENLATALTGLSQELA